MTDDDAAGAIAQRALQLVQTEEGRARVEEYLTVLAAMGKTVPMSRRALTAAAEPDPG